MRISNGLNVSIYLSGIPTPLLDWLRVYKVTKVAKRLSRMPLRMSLWSARPVMVIFPRPNAESQRGSGSIELWARSQSLDSQAKEMSIYHLKLAEICIEPPISLAWMLRTVDFIASTPSRARAAASAGWISLRSVLY